MQELDSESVEGCMTHSKDNVNGWQSDGIRWMDDRNVNCCYRVVCGLEPMFAQVFMLSDIIDIFFQ